jgi:hypothetical protein
MPVDPKIAAGITLASELNVCSLGLKFASGETAIELARDDGSSKPFRVPCDREAQPPIIEAMRRSPRWRLVLVPEEE